MANKILIKKSSVPGKIPLPADLDVGELGVNVTDQKIYTKNSTGVIVELASGGGGGGTVTSVGGTGTVSGISLSGTVTTSGNLTLGGTLSVTPSNFASQTANTVLAAPNGAAGVPTFRAIVAADIPTLNQNTTGTAANVTGTVAIANGGTGATTRQDAMDALAGAVTSGQYLRGNGTDVVMSAIQAADVPTLNQNTTGSSGSCTGNAATASNAALLNNISAVNLYNNMGQAHSTRTSFDATTPSYGFGYRFVQGNTNGPSTGASQYYSWYIGLGSEYPATGVGSYGAMFAVDRNSTTPYLSVRYNEGNGFTAWQKIRAGYADTAGNAATATNVDYSGLTGTVPTWNQNTTGTSASSYETFSLRLGGGVNSVGTNEPPVGSLTTAHALVVVDATLRSATFVPVVKQITSTDGSVTITETAPGVFDLSAGTPPPAGFDWFTSDPSPVDGTISLPTNFTASPSGFANVVVAGFTNGSWGPSGPWNSSSPGGWFGNVNFVPSFDWMFVPTPSYSYASGVSQGVAFNYVQYPAGHSVVNTSNYWGSSSSWNSGFGSNFNPGSYPPFGSDRKLFGVLVISSGGTDLTSLVSINPTFPGTTFTAYYDNYSGATVIAFENLVDSEVASIVGSGNVAIAWGGSPFSYYGHAWTEYN